MATSRQEAPVRSQNCIKDAGNAADKMDAAVSILKVVISHFKLVVKQNEEPHDES